MTRTGKLIALTTLTLAVFAISPAVHADSGTTSHMKVDVTLADCIYADLDASANPPDNLIIYRPSWPPLCGSAWEKDLDVTFNDTTGTLITELPAITSTRFGVTCGYTVSYATLDRQGTTRTYSGNVSYTRTSGNEFFCPSTISVSVTMDFR